MDLSRLEEKLKILDELDAENSQKAVTLTERIKGRYIRFLNRDMEVSGSYEELIENAEKQEQERKDVIRRLKVHRDTLLHFSPADGFKKRWRYYRRIIYLIYKKFSHLIKIKRKYR